MRWKGRGVGEGRVGGGVKVMRCFTMGRLSRGQHTYKKNSKVNASEEAVGSFFSSKSFVCVRIFAFFLNFWFIIAYQ